MRHFGIQDWRITPNHRSHTGLRPAHRSQLARMETWVFRSRSHSIGIADLMQIALCQSMATMCFTTGICDLYVISEYIKQSSENIYLFYATIFFTNRKLKVFLRSCVSIIYLRIDIVLNLWTGDIRGFIAKAYVLGSMFVYLSNYKLVGHGWCWRSLS